MKLSMSLIAKYLEPYHPECHILHDTLSIKGVRFLSDSHLQYSLEYIYLGAAKEYYHDPRYMDTLLLANGKNQIICRCTNYEELLNHVLSAFDFYAEFEQKLFLASAQHHPLEDMMQVIGTVLDCTLLIFDIDGYLLAGQRVEEIEDKNLFANITGQKRLGFTGIGEILVNADEEIFHDLSDTPQYLRSRDMDDDPGCVAMYLCQNEERVGFIMIFVKNQSQVPMCLCLEPILAQCCVNAFEFTDNSSLRQSNYSVFTKLLNGKTLAPAVLKKFQTDIGIRSNAVLMVFQSISIQNYTLHKMLMNDIRLLNTSCIACEHEGRVVIMADSSVTEEVLRLICDKIAASAMTLGVSMPLQDLNRLSIALTQTLFALNAVPGPGIRYCRDLALPYLLQTLRENEMSLNLLHPALGILKKYDSENNTELFQTLSVYVQTGYSQTDTANTIHIHLNTLKYRLNRIRELAEVDFKNQEEMFYLWLSLKLDEGAQ